MAFVLTGLAMPATADAVRPNIILIVADDLGWADLGCYGSKFHRSPNLDRLAAGGIRFTQAYAAAPVCSPSRAALLTGKYPARLHLTDFLYGRPDQPSQKLMKPVTERQLALSEPTLAEVFKSDGYATAHVGKWHLGGEGFGPSRRGFDLNIAGNESGTPPSYFAPFSNEKMATPGLENASRGE